MIGVLGFIPLLMLVGVAYFVMGVMLEEEE